MSSDVKRRYADFRPEKYDLTIEPNQDELTFRGMVDISGRLAKKRKNITLHAKDLDFESVHLTQGNKTIELVEARTSRATQEANLIFKEMIKSGLVHLHIEFEGEITEKMHGLYRSKYETDDSVEYLLATQMEANHAREVFPCIDEPEAKATFDLTLLLPKGTKAIANTPIADTKAVEDKTFVSFETTPEMPTYLLAFVVGDLEHKEAETEDGTKIRTFATAKNIEHTEFALDTAVEVMEFFNDYFDIPYPLEKLDLAAIPDFAGAMENWGLVIFRESAMLVDKENTSLSVKQQVAYVIAHELAHQWFGNLVTMKWWDDLWLKEGFATWIGHLACDQLFPKWKMWEQFVSSDYAVAQRDDALANTHPIQVEVDDPDEINEIFDAISYKKGASVIRMLHDYLGPKDFQAGLHKYLKKHSYDNTVTTDLWNALEYSSGKPVVKFMSNWTEEEGFPMVWFEPSEDEDNPQEYTFYQERFVLSPIERGNTGELEFWPIPITIVGHDQQIVSNQAFEDHELEKEVEIPKLNQGQVGFYRAKYNQNQLETLGQAITDKNLKPLDRFGVVDDTFELAKAGMHSTTEWLKLLDHLSDEENLIVWDSIAHGLMQMYRLFKDENIHELLRQFGQQLVAAQVERLGWKFSKKDSHFDRLLRPQVLGLAARFKDEDVLDTIQSKFESHQDGDKIHPDLRSVVYSGIARKKNTKTVHNKLKKMYKATDMAEEKRRLIAALCAVKDEEIFERSLNMIRSKDVRLQEVTFWLICALRNRHNYHLAWEWLTDENNWDWYTDRFRGTHDGPPVVKAIAATGANEDFAEEVEEFFDDNGYSGIDRSVDQTVERIHLQAEWVDRDQEEIVEYLEDKLEE